MKADRVEEQRFVARGASVTELANLDILRSVAVLLVVAAHFLMYSQIAASRVSALAPWMGLTGVCLFFVHTCMVLMFSLERDPHSGRFYLRRVFRLFPLWLIVLAAVVLLRVPVAPSFAPHFGYVVPSGAELLANTTMTMNLWFGARLVGASWSLPIEAQMYLLLPLLFFFICSTRALWVLLAVDALAIVSVWAVLGYRSVPAATLATCIPYFLPGVMAYALTKRVRPNLPPWAFPVFLAGLVAGHLRFGTPFRSAFFCLSIGLALPFFRQISWRPVVRAAHLIARYSYGIYLCHIPAICVGIYYLRTHSLPVRLAGGLITFVVLPVALYHGVEAPMIRLGSKLSKKIESGPAPRMNEKNMSLETAP